MYLSIYLSKDLGDHGDPWDLGDTTDFGDPGDHASGQHEYKVKVNKTDFVILKCT